MPPLIEVVVALLIPSDRYNGDRIILVYDYQHLIRPYKSKNITLLYNDVLVNDSIT